MEATGLCIETNRLNLGIPVLFESRPLSLTNLARSNFLCVKRRKFGTRLRTDVASLGQHPETSELLFERLTHQEDMHKCTLYVTLLLQVARVESSLSRLEQMVGIAVGIKLLFTV